MQTKVYLCVFSLLCCISSSFSQTDSSSVLSFSFNTHEIKEDEDQIKISPVGVTITEDRFGNDNSAIYVHGNAFSYVNMGSSDLLKSKRTTISLWVNLQAEVLAGKGYQSNPFLYMKNDTGEDFIIALGIGYSFANKRFGVQTSRDSLREASIYSTDPVELNKWYHIVATCDEHHLAFYLNGKLQGRIFKDFETVFLKGDTVVLGRSTGNKNERFTHAIFDDLKIYHRVLSAKEIDALYHEPNPNRLKNFLVELLKYGSIVLMLGIVIIVILIRNKKNLQKQKETYELNTKIKELEIKVIRNQMNPHFISNCLAAIQNLIYTNQTDRAAQYLARFSFFLRQVLEHSDRSYISLEEELTLIKLNVELEQLRFDDNFTFNIDFDHSVNLADVSIPSLITQPFIENSIWHGLLPLEERSPRLNIHIHSKNDAVFVEIEDNGIGRAASATAHQHSMGTKLAMDKMESTNKLRNSSDYKMEIVDLFDEHNHAQGTKVIIQLLNATEE